MSLLVESQTSHSGESGLFAQTAGLGENSVSAAL
jgi:hypothetical protein